MESPKLDFFPVSKNKMHKIIILILLVLYGCETWCLTLKERHRLRLFQNRVLRREYLDLRGKKLGEDGQGWVSRRGEKREKSLPKT
jgi:hypothetical protein